MQAHLEMQTGPVGHAGRTHEPYYLSGVDMIADLGEHLALVAVDRGDCEPWSMTTQLP